MIRVIDGNNFALRIVAKTLFFQIFDQASKLPDEIKVDFNCLRLECHHENSLGVSVT